MHFGNLKTEASGKPVPMGPVLSDALLLWRERCPFPQEDGYLFGSPQTGRPYWSTSMLSRHLQPAAVRAGITKRIGWHTLRRTLATLLQASGASVKSTQDMLRHANSAITLDLYAQTLPAEQRAAQTKVMEVIAA